MPAIGTSWRSGSWQTPAWASGTWASVAVPYAGKYRAEHASALADVRAAGLPVTFTKTTNTHDATTGSITLGAPIVVPGYAMRVQGDPKQYEILKLVQSEAPTLFFVPLTYGTLPPLNAMGTFGGVRYAIRAIKPLAPDGVAIAGRLVVAQ